jgi:protoheme IX farnesyltransferase
MLRQENSAVADTTSLLTNLMVLFKVRIVLLLVLAAAAGAFLGARGWPGWDALLLVLVTGGLAAMGSSAWNQHLERATDGLMDRTRKRPLVTGVFAHTRWLPFVASAMIATPVLAVLPFNRALAFFLALGAFIYVVIYTVWLKSRTPLNIVIGGAAGSAAVLAGGAAVGAWQDPAVILLSVLLFFWTPIHFWALALVHREDYVRARVPMLPATTTARTAAAWTFVHGVGVGASGVGIALLPELGPIYDVPVAVMTALLVGQAFLLIGDPVPRRAYRLFHTSNFYLFVVVLAIMLGLVTNRLTS